MNVYAQLFPLTLPPVAASCILYLLERRTAFGKLRYGVRQLLYGLVFGALAIFSTEFGMNVQGANMNVRSAVPLCAGLIFGAPAGLIAGCIGGVERYLATFWGAGAFTQLACSISTAVSGALGALLRRFMFDDKKPSCWYGLAAGIVVEVFDMLMIFLLRMDATREAFAIVQICSSPMILMNGICAMAAVGAVSLLSGEARAKATARQLSQTFQKWLLLLILVAFIATCVFTYAWQTRMSEGQTDSLLSLNIEDVQKDITDTSDENLLGLTRRVAKALDAAETVDDALLRSLAETWDIPEIDVIGEDGVIALCTNPEFVGFDMASNEQSRAFLPLLGDQKELVQAYQPIGYDREISRKYAGVKLARGGFVQVGYDAARFQQEIDAQVKGATRNRRVGEEGYLILCDSRMRIVSDPHTGSEDQYLLMTGIWDDFKAAEEGVRFSSTVYMERCECMYRHAEGYYIVAVYPRREAVFHRNVSVYIMIFMEVLIFSSLFVVVYFLIKHLIVDNIRRINRQLGRITGGDLEVTVDVRSNAEFASLSDDINSTVVTLKRYIAEAAARIDEELAFAKAIQHSALPAAFPGIPEADLFGSMRTAKEVGGDFYDYYFLGEDRLAFIIADVSGKGIPAAMFMMTSKTLVKDLAETGLNVAEAFTRANQELCANNDAGMFVTAWMGVLDLRTGLVTFANAGHNPPLVRHADGSAEYLKTRAGFVLAGMEGLRYRAGELLLAPGDTLFLYTDGVTEATDAGGKLYGEERLLRFLCEPHPGGSEALCRAVLADVDRFVGGAPQFDDITMLCLRFLKKKEDGAQGECGEGREGGEG